MFPNILFFNSDIMQIQYQHYFFICLVVGGQRFIITPRLLHYGTYFVQMNASMCNTNDRNTTYLVDAIYDTFSSIHGYFQIKACDLEAKILGGNGKAVAYFGNTMLITIQHCLTTSST